MGITREELEDVFRATIGGATNCDSVNNPKHYNTGKIEVIDAIDDWGLGFSLGNAIKYLARAGKKDRSKTTEDLRKAVWYIKHEIERIEKSNSEEEK